MNRFLPVLIIPLIVSCSASRRYNPNKKFGKETLQQDYSLLRNILEEKHPSLYWYTSKDSMDFYFDRGYGSIADSMTELQFGWNVLAPLLSTIHCGHTSFMMSKQWNGFIKNRVIPSFPLRLKVWSDSMMVIQNLNKKDSTIKRGDFVTGINGLKNPEIIRTLFENMVEDGYGENVNFSRLSSSFPYFHRNVFGLYQNYFVNFTDSKGVEKRTLIPYYAPAEDSVKKEIKEQKIKYRRIGRGKKLAMLRNVQYDSNAALITINSFSKSHLRSFLRRTFREIRKDGIENIMLDLRFNGGGNISNSVLLTKYIRNTPFKVADSAYSTAKNFAPFSSHISSGFFNNIGLLFVTKRKKDGNYHFGFWENHHFYPKRKNHFTGKTYVLVGGPTFSASTLFCNAVKGQDNVILAGEETGGGWYGNSGILIPNVTLPNTKLRVRLPFFKLVQFNHIEQKGTGVIPDIYIGTNWRDILNGIDTKVKVVKEIIGHNSNAAMNR